MTPAEVEAMPDQVYAAFVLHMQREAYEMKKAAAARNRGRR
jgi:hypothetical protein